MVKKGVGKRPKTVKFRPFPAQIRLFVQLLKPPFFARRCAGLARKLALRYTH
jgi:hypothetical protein